MRTSQLKIVIQELYTTEQILVGGITMISLGDGENTLGDDVFYMSRRLERNPMKRLRYLGLVTLMAVANCNVSGQTVRQKDRVISGSANLSKLETEGPGAVKDDKLRKILQDSSVSAVILQNRTTHGGATSRDYGYWILYAKGRDTNLKMEKISKEDFKWLINFADRVDED